MKITASYLYPDFSSKRKYNSFSAKKSVKKNEKSFKEYLQDLSGPMNKENNNIEIAINLFHFDSLNILKTLAIQKIKM